jgi:HPt (histidine-containing phosphotransfer) domain-containing protein
MAATILKDVAFDRPGGESCQVGRSRPVDLAHLSRQTMGDRALEQEVLALFAQQAAAVSDQIARASVGERLRLAHGLKGSARGVGAFAIADCVVDVERRPEDKDNLDRLAVLINEARQFIASIHR